MLANVIGRVNNTHLPKSQSLLPLYEAIINSIDAIEELFNEPQRGKISIKITRHPTLLSNDPIVNDPRYKDPIKSFSITDNGIGFTEKNLQAFNEADSLNKQGKGGKGVGRFIWLKAFSYVTIRSCFSKNGKKFLREFEFSTKTASGISLDKVQELEDDLPVETTITLNGFLQDYEENCPKNLDTIGQRIVEHCLSYFLLGRMPLIVISDGEESIDLWEIYADLLESEQRHIFSIKEKKFELIHFRLQPHGDNRHRICYCANSRVVKSEILTANLFPNLPTPIVSDEQEFIYAGYVLSEYLDQSVNQLRTDFDLLIDGNLPFNDLTYENISKEVFKLTSEYLHPYTEQIREQKVERISNYVNDNAPQYRHILKHHPERIDQIPIGNSDDKIDSQLYEISRDIEQELREDAKSILSDDINIEDEKTERELLIKFEKWWSEYNDVGKANLAKYIVHRRIAIEMLEKSLNLQDTGRYSKEEVIHRIIFPLKTTSDDVLYEDHNLWLLDEKLAYHHYLASDVPLKKQGTIDSNSALRPDLAIFFNSSIAVVDDDPPYSSGIVLIEFKRPMRDDYEGEDNPITQVLNYITEIVDNKSKSKDGRLISVTNRTPFYCYIVSDLTPSLKRQAENYGLKITADNSGYIGFNPNHGAYIEIIGFDKLLMDAKRRNRILFDKLNLLP